GGDDGHPPSGPATAPAPCRRVFPSAQCKRRADFHKSARQRGPGRGSEEDADRERLAVATQRDAEANRPALAERDVDAEVDREVEVEVVTPEAAAAGWEVVVAETRIHHEAGRAVGREGRTFRGQRTAERDAEREAEQYVVLGRQSDAHEPGGVQREVRGRTGQRAAEVHAAED